MWFHGNYVSLEITLTDARSASHAGRCDEDVKALSEKPYIRRQLAKLDSGKVWSELREYGAWTCSMQTDEERAENLQRLLWIAAGEIAERYSHYKHR